MSQQIPQEPSAQQAPQPLIPPQHPVYIQLSPTNSDRLKCFLGQAPRILERLAQLEVDVQGLKQDLTAAVQSTSADNPLMQVLQDIKVRVERIESRFQPR